MTEVYGNIRNIWMFAMLLAGSISDIRKKSVSVRYLVLTAAGCILLSLPHFDLIRFFTALLPGLLLLLISRISDGAVGEGDAYAVCFVGITLGLHATAAVLMITMLILCIYAQALIVTKRAGPKSRIALYPFLVLACILRQLLII